MRIVIDMQGAQTSSRFRGIGRYTLSFAQAVVRNRGEHEVILVLSGLFPDTIEPIRTAFDGLMSQDSIRVWHVPGPVRDCEYGNNARRQVAEVIREAFLASLHPDLIHVTSLFEGYLDDAVTSIGAFDKSTPVSVTLYDLIPLLNKTQYLDSNKSYADSYLRKVDNLRSASLYLAISKSSKIEIIDTLDVDSRKVFNISAAVDENFCHIAGSECNAEEVLVKFKIKKPFILYSGSTDERKNLHRLIHAFSLSRKSLLKKYTLVLAGGLPNEHRIELEKTAKKYNINSSELIITSYVSDNELISLYKKCDLYVFPSWHEGFGLPVLEAMSCGAAVICANTSSLPEVIDLDEATFDPFDVSSIEKKMVSALNDAVFLRRLKEHGLRQSKKFSWDVTGKKAIRAWESLPIKLNSEFTSCDEKNTNKADLNFAIAKNLIHENDNYILKLSRSIALNFNAKSTLNQLFVDISELVERDACTGIQRVVRSILREWISHPPHGFRVVPVYAKVNNSYRYAQKFLAKFLDRPFVGVVDEPIDYGIGDVFFALDFQPQVQTEQAEFYQQLRQQGVIVKFMVYDLLCINFPMYFPPTAKQGFSNWLTVVRESDGAVCISNSVATDLASWLSQQSQNTRRRPFKIIANHLGADINDLERAPKLADFPNERISRIKDSPSFLMVGTLEPRKGHAQVLDAFDRLWKAGAAVNLVFVGKQGWMVDELIAQLRSHTEFNSRLLWLEGIDDEHLEQVYAASTCLIAASYGEGFGLPLIEAAQHQLPIIARDIPVFREVAGNHAYYFDAQQPAELAQAIEAWLILYRANQHPKSGNMRWLTWKESAAQLLKALDLPAPIKTSINELKGSN
jgi:glycosyltransferase involved in cell wall biosynthesis